MDSEAESVVPTGGGCWTRAGAVGQSPWLLGKGNNAGLGGGGSGDDRVEAVGGRPGLGLMFMSGRRSLS